MSLDLSQSLQRALQHLQAGRHRDCLKLCDQLLIRYPGTIQALYLRGCASFHTGDHGRSIDDLETVHRNQPQHLHAAYYYGRSLRVAGRLEAALEPLQSALAEPNLEIHSRYELAICLTGLRRRTEAIDHYQSIFRLQPGNAQVAANLAALLERENQLEQADIWTSKALSLDAYNETAQITRARLDRRCGHYSQAVQRLKRLIKKLEHPNNLSIAWNQLGQCHESQGHWNQAFNAFTESNRVLMTHHAGARSDPRGPHGLQTLERIHSWLQLNPVRSWKKPSSPDRGGIAFLVGFPRSGTTLLDHMLGSHPAIEVLEEKSLFSSLHQDWSAAGTLEALAGISDAQINDARHIYHLEVSRHRRQPGRSLVIDKLPLNLAYIFLIHRLFPQAPIIFLQRHPLDVCVSCYFQAFELQASMAYFLDIRQTARYFNAVMQVAKLSLEQVSNPLHCLRYEDLVITPEAQLRALLGFLTLQWDDSMLNYRQHGDVHTSNTPSYQQVSQPLYTRSIGKWQHYANQLEPCFPALMPWVEHFQYDKEPSS